MCGIAGIFAYGADAPPVDVEELLRIREAMVTRGPDGSGLWISADKRTGLAHRRLAIIDLSEAGAQPMCTPDGKLHVTFNGEIYNYRELRRELEDRGYHFQSNSDTEVLLHLYADRGEAMVHALRGMYAFAIWDERQRSLFLARDPFGIKPLYYTDDGAVFRFASQVKALLKGGAIDTAPEPAGSVGFLIWGYVPEPFTLYRDIRSLLAGTHMRLSLGGVARTTQFFDIAAEFRQAEHTGAVALHHAREIMRTALDDSVRNHLVSDVPVALFLSAGIDSSALTSFASARADIPLKAITLGFPEFRGGSNDEVPTASLVAAGFGVPHEVHPITREDFESEVDHILAEMDQPTTDGVNTYFVSRAASRSGMKVAFSGLGGDELFGGYPSFTHVPRLAKWPRLARRFPLGGRLLRRVLSPILKTITSPKYAGILEYGGTYGGAYLLRRALFMPWEISSTLDPATTALGLERLQLVKGLDSAVRGLSNPRSRIATLELAWYMRNQLLRDADWAGMANSVEIRVPFVDVALFRALAPLIASSQCPTKRDLAEVCPQRLPTQVTARAKTGFVAPVGDWLRSARPANKAERGLRSWAKEVLPAQPRMFRALALVTDAYGGKGGIAKFNRDLLESVASLPECSGVVAVPRLIRAPVETMPSNIEFAERAAGSKFRFGVTALSAALRGRIDVLIVGHVNLAPLGAIITLLRRIPSVLIIHGIDAWEPHKSPLVRLGIRRFSVVAGVSQLTLNRFSSWTGLDMGRQYLLPNCVDLHAYRPGPRPAQLAARLGLNNRTVLLTVGRLESLERFKGFDEIIECLPTLARHVPNISYLICGEGNDRRRLEEKAEALGQRDRVVFAGFVPEELKADYYRLADAYVMPSRGEGFGIVFLEALASGLPVMGSLVDGSREALLDGDLGRLVDPSNANDVADGVLETLRRGKGSVQARLSYYSREAFSQKTSALIRSVLKSSSVGGSTRRPSIGTTH